MKTILTYGTFDLFHIGHLKILERSKALGDKLYVGISSDEFNAIKGKKSLIPYDHRAEIVNAIDCVDGVFPEHHWEQKEEDIKRLNIDTFVMGHDWEGKFDHLSNLCDVVYLPRTNGISTTEIKNTLNMLDRGKMSELIQTLDTLKVIIKELRD